MLEGHLRSFGPYQLDLGKEQLRCDTQPVRLTPKAFQVLSYIVERRGQLVTKEELFRGVWADTVVGDAALTMCIQEIRKALQDDAKSPHYLETVHRRGFRFLGEVVSSQYPVGSIQEVASSQSSVVSREEQSTNGQEIDAVMPAKAGIQESQALASDDPPLIPAFAGMTPPPSAHQVHNPSPQSDPALGASTLPAQRFWSVRSLIIMGFVLLVSTILPYSTFPF